jgi:hypothetical protein
MEKIGDRRHEPFFHNSPKFAAEKRRICFTFPDQNKRIGDRSVCPRILIQNEVAPPLSRLLRQGGPSAPCRRTRPKGRRLGPGPGRRGRSQKSSSASHLGRPSARSRGSLASASERSMTRSSGVRKTRVRRPLRRVCKYLIPRCRSLTKKRSASI